MTTIHSNHLQIANRVSAEFLEGRRGPVPLLFIANEIDSAVYAAGGPPILLKEVARYMQFLPSGWMYEDRNGSLYATQSPPNSAPGGVEPGRN